MKRFTLFSLFLLLICVSGVRAQNATQVKALYEAGAYEEVKPELLKLLKAQPSNGNYNLWYGVACLRTKAAAEAVKYLEIAVKRRVAGGQFYLAQAYRDVYRYEDAVRTAEAYLSDLQKRKRPTEEAELLLENCRSGLRMMKGVERVCVVDSVVVDKERFWEAYRLSPEAGTLFTYAAYFGKESGEENYAPDSTAHTLFLTNRGNNIYYSRIQPDSTSGIYTNYKLMDEWGEERALPDNINLGNNARYPYMSADGSTLYYAADGNSSLGGYDIFVTRYNSDSGTCFTPENIGMPFNSPSNDYLYVVDEFYNLGWFASDRNQPSDKVCIYIFVPNESKQVYNYENMEEQELIRLASLCPIADTWGDESVVQQARLKLQAAAKAWGEKQVKPDFEFVIDDTHTYHTLSDFHSLEARESYRKYSNLMAAYRDQAQQLANLRARYAQANESEKSRMAASILSLENQLQQQLLETEQVALLVRNQEKSTLK